MAGGTVERLSEGEAEGRDPGGALQALKSATEVLLLKLNSGREKARARRAWEFGRELSRGPRLRQIFTCGSHLLFFSS